MRPSLIMHANYGEQGQTLKEMCQLAERRGFEGIEFRRKLTDGRTAEMYLDEIASAMATSALNKVSFGLPGPDLMTHDEKKRENEIMEYENFLELATQRFDLEILNTNTGPLLDRSQGVDPADREMHGSAFAKEEHWERAYVGMRRIAKSCERLKVKLAFEVHSGYLHDLPISTLKLVSLIESPWIGANLDYGNIIYFEKHPTLAESVSMLSSHIFMVHLKNSLKFGDQRRTVPLAEGDINNREFLRLLQKSNFEGYLCLESPRSGDREHFALQDITYTRLLLEELAWT